MRNFVEFYDGRRMFTETEVKRLNVQRSIIEALCDMPEYAWGFKFYSVADEVEAPLGPKGVKFAAYYTRLDESGTYFVGGKLLDLEDVELLAEGDPHQFAILASNMRSNGMSHVVKTRTGNTQEFKPKVDHILPNHHNKEAQK